MRPLAVIVFMLTFAAPMAWAQTDRLSAVLVKGVACSAPDAMAGLQRNLSNVDASPIDTRAALGAIAADTAICSPIRQAAEDLVTSTFAAAAGPSAATSNSIIAEALAEAERRAANMKFEVGPPPPRLTRGRNPGL